MLIILFLVSCVLMFLSFVYLKKRYKDPMYQKGILEIIKEEYKYFIVCILFLIGLFIIEIIYKREENFAIFPLLLKWHIFLWGMLLIAKVDIKQHLIPNHLLLSLFGVRAGFLIYEIISNFDFWQEVVKDCVIGALAGLILLFIARVLSMLLSKSAGVGMGDLKMFFVVGAFVGSSKILMTMFYTFFASALIGVVFLAFKKAKLKDSLAMAPFAFVGILIEFILLMIGG